MFLLRSSQNSDVASIEPIPKDSVGCTSSAVVYVQSKSPSRRITLILAENEITGTVLQVQHFIYIKFVTVLALKS